MRSIGIIVWLVFAAMLLGWYGLVMAALGAVVYVGCFLVHASYKDRKAAKRRKESGA